MLLYIHHLKGCLYLNVWRQKHWVSCILVTFTILVSQNYYQKGLFLSTNQMFSDRSDLVKTPLFFWPLWSRSTSHMHILKAFGWWLLLILCFRVFAKYLYFFLPQLRNILKNVNMFLFFWEFVLNSSCLDFHAVTMVTQWVWNSSTTEARKQRAFRNYGTLEFIPSWWCLTQTVFSATLNT